MFGIEQLEAFVTTVETGSFSGAARQLKKAQSVISQHIINLEIDCGVDLFIRSGRYPTLTSQGEKLIPHAKATLLQHQRLKNTVELLCNDQPSQLCIGIDEGIPMQKVSNAIAKLQAAYPNIQLEIFGASSIDIIEMLESGRVSTGLVFSELLLPNSIDFECIGAVKFDMYVAKNHSLAKITVPNMDHLRLHRQLLIRSRNTQTSSFQQAFSPDIWHANNYYLLLELALEGYGWCLLPEHIAQQSVNEGTLVRVSTEFEELGWLANIDVIQHQRDSSHPLFKQVRELFRLG
ncbi:MAG: LysR family transcriptional regulator [Vibrio hibernica]